MKKSVRATDVGKIPDDISMNGIEGSKPKVKRIFPEPDKVELGYVAVVAFTATTLIIGGIVVSNFEQQGSIVAVMRRVVVALALLLAGLCPAGILIQLVRRRLPSLPMLLCWIAASTWASIIAMAIYFRR